MTIVSFNADHGFTNLNGTPNRVRQSNFEEWIRQLNPPPDVILCQESRSNTKNGPNTHVKIPNFTRAEAPEMADKDSRVSSYYSNAKSAPVLTVHDERWQELRVDHRLILHNVYFPSNRDAADRNARVGYLRRLTNQASASTTPIGIAGDFNLAPTRDDYCSPQNSDNRRRKETNYYADDKTFEAFAGLMRESDLIDPLRPGRANWPGQVPSERPVVTTSQFRFRCDLFLISKQLTSRVTEPTRYEHGARKRNAFDVGPVLWTKPFTNHSAVILTLAI